MLPRSSLRASSWPLWRDGRRSMRSRLSLRAKSRRSPVTLGSARRACYRSAAPPAFAPSLDTDDRSRRRLPALTIGAGRVLPAPTWAGLADRMLLSGGGRRFRTRTADGGAGGNGRTVPCCAAAESMGRRNEARSVRLCRPATAMRPARSSQKPAAERYPGRWPDAVALPICG